MSDAANRLDLAGLKMAEGFFLIRDPAVAAAPFQPREPTREQTASPYRHVFTYKSSPQTIREAALEVIDSAREKVFLASFLIGDKDLLDALYRAVDRLRGGVYVISALDEKSLRAGLAETGLDDDPDAADQRAHHRRFEDMTGRGIAVRGHENFHAKFIVADDRRALVSSANLVTRAFDTTGENGVMLTDPREADRLGRYFARLWASCTYEMPPSRAHTVQRRDATPAACQVPVPPIGDGHNLIWTYPGEHLILDTVRDVIRRTRHHLLLATFGLTGLTENAHLLIDPLHEIMGPVDEATGRRDPEVSLLVRSRNNMAGHRRDAGTLAELGVTIYADQLNHAKGVIADEAHGALFSANFDAQHGLDSGAEVGVRLDGTPALGEAIRYFRHAVAHSDQVFDPAPTQQALDRRLAARWRQAWPLEPRLRVRAEDACWRRLVHPVVPPVLYVQFPDGHVDLLAGTSSFRLSYPDEHGVRALSAGDSPDRPAAQLLQNWLTYRGPASSRGEKPIARGFCPAVIERVTTKELE